MTAPRLVHTKPCGECPWRREHPAGWLGGYRPEQYTDQVHHDGPPLSCHPTIGKRVEAMCAGALIHMRNSCKSPRHPGYGDALSRVTADPVTVFEMPHEFLAYHSDPDAWVRRSAEAILSEKGKTP